jgi:hypothetical protein
MKSPFLLPSSALSSNSALDFKVDMSRNTDNAVMLNGGLGITGFDAEPSRRSTKSALSHWGDCGKSVSDPPRHFTDDEIDKYVADHPRITR